MPPKVDRKNPPCGQLFYFNYGNEVALAHQRSVSYTPPRIVRQMRRDLAYLPAWIAPNPEQDWVWLPCNTPRFSKEFPFSLAQYIGKKSGKPLRVKVITIDNWRIGASYQMNRYCELMGIPLTVAASPDDVRKCMALYREEADVICIDTIGRSPKDREKISIMQNYFTELGDDAEVYLTVCAGTRINDIREIMKEYAVFKYKSLIITKFDETSYIGNLLSIISETDIPITYITVGQAVPQDLMPADIGAFLRKLKGFSVDVEYINQLSSKDRK